MGVAIAATPRDAAAFAADIVLLSGSGVAALPFLLGVAERTQVCFAVPTALCCKATARDNVQLWTSYSGTLSMILLSFRTVQAIIKQNMCLALGSIAALALPVLLGWLPLWVAVTLHEGSTLLVAINSLRLLRWDDSAEAELAIKDATASAEQMVKLDERPMRSHDATSEPVLAAAAA